MITGFDCCRNAPHLYGMNHLLGIAFCLLVSCKVNQSINYINDLQQGNIKGKVAKLITYTYPINEEGKTGKLESETIEVFNTLGYTVTDTSRSYTEKKEVVNLLEYNIDGSMYSLTSYENGQKQSKMYPVYNDTKCIAIAVYDSGDHNRTFYNNITQTDQGQLLSAQKFTVNEHLLMSYVNTYDSIYQIKAVARDSNGNIRSDVTIHLTEKKYPADMLEVSYGKDSIIQKFSFYHYKLWDSAGNWIEQDIYDDKGKPAYLVKRIFIYLN